MSLPVQQEAFAGAKVDAQTAREIADIYLMDYVGDLLGTGTPWLAEDGCWTMPIVLSNARRGEIGPVGTISVDAETGEVLFSEEDRAKVKAGARLLPGAPSL
jgi:hypothetical protein